MTGQAMLAALLGAGVGLGLVLVAAGLRGSDTTAKPRRWRARFTRRGAPLRPAHLLAAVAAAVVVGAVTRWPVGAVLAGVAVWTLPRLLGRDRDHQRRLARIEAIAAWTEMLRDTLAAAAGLEQAIAATAPIAPEPIRAEVTALAHRLQQGERLGVALRQLADDLSDPTGDLVVAALVLAAEQQARDLAPLLSSLASAARDQAGLRMRIAASRARIRTSARIIVGVTVAMAAGLVVFNSGYLDPYDTVVGQVILVIVGGLFAAAFAGLSRLTRLPEPARFLTTESAETGGGVR